MEEKMKKYLILLACTTFLAQAVQAEDYIGEKTLKDKTLQDANFMGSAQLTNVKADSLSILGTLEFHNLTVTKGTSIAGPIKKSENGKFGSLSIVGEFEATNVTCEKLDAAGSVSLTGLTVSGNANIAGALTLKASKDPKTVPNKLQNLNIAAEEISLEDTVVEGNIVVKKPSSWLGGAKKQILRLLGKTTIKGAITFESGTGTIEQGPDAKIEGKVTGVNVEKK
jgi:hypothetical protein